MRSWKNKEVMREHCWQRHRFIWSRLFRHFDHECWQILFSAAFTPTQILDLYMIPSHPRLGQRCLSQVCSLSILLPVTAGLGSHRHTIINTFNWRLLTFMAFREKCFQFSRSSLCPGQAKSHPAILYFVPCLCASMQQFWLRLYDEHTLLLTDITRLTHRAAVWK